MLIFLSWVESVGVLGFLMIGFGYAEVSHSFPLSPVVIGLKNGSIHLSVKPLETEIIYRISFGLSQQ